MLRAVAFDLDATLTDFLRFKRIASDSAALAMVDAGLDLPYALAAERLWECYRREGLDGDVAFERFLSECGRPEPALLAAGIQAYLRAKDAHLEPYPRVLETLIGLTRRGLRLAIVTDAERRKAHARLAALRIAPFFEHVITLEDSPQGKADEAPFRLLLERLRCIPEEVLMVGDNAPRDVRSAQRAGLHTAFAAYGAQAPCEEAPDFVLHRVDDVLRVVDRLSGAARAEHAPLPAWLSSASARP
jgi:putative hydrolase of the HAD superfamily